MMFEQRMSAGLSAKLLSTGVVNASRKPKRYVTQRRVYRGRLTHLQI